MHTSSRRLMATVALAAASILSGVATAGAAGTHHPVRAPLFGAPTSIAFDLFRDAYVADSSRGEVIKLSPTGTHLLTLRGPAGAPLSAPIGVAADARHHVYVTERGGGRVDQFSYAGKRLSVWGPQLKLSAPQAAAIDALGNVYVADSGNSRVVKMSPRGVLVSSWYGVTPPAQKPKKGTKPTGPRPINIGRFLHPQGVTVDFAGNVFVSDTGHNRLVELTPSGIPVKVWGRQGSAVGEFNGPTGLAPDAGGNLWIADTGNNRVQHLFLRSGGFTTLGSQGAGDGQFNAPRGLAADAKGSLYVADTGNSRIEKFSKKGAVTAIWK